MSRRPRRRKIKANRKPKIVRDRSWKTQVLRGDPDEIELPDRERVVPRGRQEERVKLWEKLEDELSGRPEPCSLDQVPADWRKGIVTRVSTGLYHVDLDGETVLCAVRGSLSASNSGYTNVVAVGDRVYVTLEHPGDGIIESVAPRRTVLARPDVVNPDLSQVIVANVDQLLIVTAWEEPTVWLELIDRYLIAAAEGNLEPLICLNKIDLAEHIEDCRETMAIYERLGYTVLYTSAVTGAGVDALRDHLIGKQTVLAGRSGVGKSSLLMAVQPGLHLKVSEVSGYTGEGRHATSQVSLLKLDSGGYVVDTPGIRELGLLTIHRYELILHFPEIAAEAEGCRFSDCSHTIEPDCAVIKAVRKGQIPWSRYSSYLAIYDSLPEYYTE